MVCRTLVALALALTGCQQLPEEDDDAATSMSAGNVDTGGGTFLDEGPGSEGAGDEGQVESECDPSTQTGCSEGEKCAVQKVGVSVTYVCAPDTGTLEPFAGCTPALTTGDDDCLAGYACVGSETQAACVPLCVTDGDCDGGVCVLDPLNFVPHCGLDCSPFEPNCPTPLQCRREENRFSCKFALEEDIGVGLDPCVETDDAGCAAGFACIAGELVPSCESDHCCTPLCDLGGVDTCTAPATCAPALLGAAPGFENVGACFVPA